MNSIEEASYRRGVMDVIELARRTADTLEARSRRPLQEGFAVEALRALADEAAALVRAQPSGTASPQP